MSDRGERVGVNEALFREVNDRIDELQVDLGQARRFEIVCECGNAECVERFTIDADAYTDLRRDVHTFAVVPGHEDNRGRTRGRDARGLFRRREDRPGRRQSGGGHGLESGIDSVHAFR